MANTSTVEEERETTKNTDNATNSPIVGEGESNINGNTVYVQVSPSSFRAVVQKLTGAPLSSTRVMPISSLPSAKRPKLQERRRGMAPARLDIPFATHLQFLAQIQKPVPVSDFFFSPISTIDYAAFLASNSPPSSALSPTSFVGIVGPTVVLTKEEEEREEKVISQKGFYLHHSPRGAANNGAKPKPKLLPLFPILSPKPTDFSSIRS